MTRAGTNPALSPVERDRKMANPQTKMRFLSSLMLAVIFITFFLFLIPRMGHSDSGAGPHGGSLGGDEKQTVELKLDHRLGNIDVYLLGAMGEIPPNILIYLPSDPNHHTPIELRAVDAGSSIPHFRGSFNPFDAPNAAVEVRIPLGGKSFKSFRIRPREEKK
ncbi:MAG: hypothetical protein ACXWPM_08525 [Bdellovibrionota bacterium]